MDDRRMVCGADVRRFGIGPEDEARAEALVARVGGRVELYATGAGCAVRWERDGVSVTASGVTYGAALSDLQRSVTS